MNLRRLRNLFTPLEIRKGLVFLIVFGIVSAVALAFYSISLVSQFFAWVASSFSQALLSFIGLQTELVWREFPHLVAPAFDAEINEICWGKIEFSILAGIIFASADRSIRSRVFGYAAGVALLAFAFNPLRIALSLYFIHPIIHDVLFRLMLVGMLVGYYAFWYLWWSKPVKPKMLI